MKKSMLTKKIVDLSAWLEMNPNHASFTANNRELLHYQTKLKQLEINDAFPV